MKVKILKENKPAIGQVYIDEIDQLAEKYNMSDEDYTMLSEKLFQLFGTLYNRGYKKGWNKAKLKYTSINVKGE